MNSSLENSMDCITHGVAKSQTRLSDFHFHLIHRESYQRLIFHTLVVLILKSIVTFRADAICKKALFSHLGNKKDL